MANKYFIWLADSCVPRRGPALTKGKTYDAGDFPAEAVEEWVGSGAARWAETETKPRKGDKGE